MTLRVVAHLAVSIDSNPCAGVVTISLMVCPIGGTNGFTAVPGWDPLSGLGTPNYPKLLEVFISLP